MMIYNVKHKWINLNIYLNLYYKIFKKIIKNIVLFNLYC